MLNIVNVHHFVKETFNQQPQLKQTLSLICTKLTILKINIYCSCSILQWMRNKISLGHKLQEIKKARPRKKAQKQTMNFDLDRT